MVSANPRFHKSEEGFRDQCEKVLVMRTEEGLITDRDADLIRLFIAELRAVSGISNSRAAKLTGQLAGTRRWIGPFDKICTPDVYLAVDKINNEKDFTRNTKADISRGLKRFLSGYARRAMLAPGCRLINFGRSNLLLSLKLPRHQRISFLKKRFSHSLSIPIMTGTGLSLPCCMKAGFASVSSGSSNGNK